MGTFKNGLKKILPPPVNSFMREVNRIIALEEKNQELIAQLIAKTEQQSRQIELQNAALQYQEKQIRTLQEIQNQQKEDWKRLYEMQREEMTDILTKMNDNMLTEINNNILEQGTKQEEHAEQRQAVYLQQQNEYFQTIYTAMKEQRSNDEQMIQVGNLQRGLLDDLKQAQNALKDDIKAARTHAWKSQKNTEEILWAETFHDAASNSSWLNDKAFSAGRWAVGYQYLYAVYRILDEVKPKKLLELGLGQSTRLLSQYAASNAAVQHKVVEHDSDWISFFQKDFPLSDCTEIVQLEREYIKFCEDEKVLAFKNFYETFENQKFDFISIDAPLGGEAIVYARVDILNLLPECLEESFIIVVDDFNRQGEKNMVKILEQILTEHEIAYAKGIYSGAKDCMVICSEDLKFICSM